MLRPRFVVSGRSMRIASFRQDRIGPEIEGAHDRMSGQGLLGKQSKEARFGRQAGYPPLVPRVHAAARAGHRDPRPGPPARAVISGMNAILAGALPAPLSVPVFLRSQALLVAI